MSLICQIYSTQQKMRKNININGKYPNTMNGRYSNGVYICIKLTKDSSYLTKALCLIYNPLHPSKRGT